jgi:hypothetical protein
MDNRAIAGVAGRVEPVPTDLGSINGRLGDVCEHLRQQNTDLRIIADRVTGTVPEATSPPKPGPAAVPNGAVAMINESLDMVAMLLTEQRDIVRRISNLA